MGFLNFLKKQVSDEEAYNSALGVPPGPNNLSKDNLDVPSPPKPLNISQKSPSSTVNEFPNFNESKPTSGTPGFPEVPSSMKSLSEEPLDLPEIPSFAEKFGTSPNPKVQDHVETMHEKHIQVPAKEDLSSKKVSSNPLPNFSQKVPTLDLGLPNPKKDLRISPHELPIHEHIDKKLDEHVDRDFISKTQFETYEGFIRPKLMDIKKEPKSSFTSHTSEKKSSVLLTNKAREAKVKKKIDLDKPLFLHVDTCGVLKEEVLEAINIIKGREGDKTLSYIDKNI
ncbi:MAG: hypothetical protein U9Q61_09645, partial [Thermodesulfobacteriota bacterium]|nr:hypothetical protein [Thermodesulfobacteriota bacterium]